MFAKNTIQKRKYNIAVQHLPGIINELNSELRAIAADRDVVLVLGNTGAGKSTFTNYLAGRPMRQENIDGLTRVVCEDPVFDIGHGRLSHTAMPQLYVDSDTEIAFCDCPGFLDNRGSTKDITNVYGIKCLSSVARNIKGIVILFDYHSLLADRSRGLDEAMNILKELLGDSISDYAASIHVIITKAPTVGDMAFTKSALRHFLASEHDPFVECLLELDQVNLYDPLDRGLDSINRDEIIQKVVSSPGMLDAASSFQLALGTESKLALETLVAETELMIRDNFIAREWLSVKSGLELIANLQLLGCDYVTKTVNRVNISVFDSIELLANNPANLSCLEYLSLMLPEVFHDSLRMAISTIHATIEEQRQQNAQLNEAQKLLAAAQSESERLTNEQSNLNAQLSSAWSAQSQLQSRIRDLENRQMPVPPSPNPALQHRIRELEEECRELRQFKLQAMQLLQQTQTYFAPSIGFFR